MRRRIYRAALVLASLLPACVLAQTSTAREVFGLEPGDNQAGFRLIEERDGSRAVTGGASARAQPRPIRIYLWYPAERAEGTEPVRFGRYAALADEDIWPAEIAGGLRERLKYSSRTLARSLGPEGFETLLERPMLAVEDAGPLAGPFPLIVVGVGLYYESPIAFAALAEYLAGRGFVVATCPLVGTNSPLVRIDLQDLETQVRDLEFVVARARRLPFVSPERLGVFGFDMGGMAGLILAMRNADVDAFLSASSGILYPHPSGLPAASPDYDPAALRVPWMHAESPDIAPPPPGSSEAESLFARATHSNRYLLMAEGMGHVDFTSYGLIEDRPEMFAYWAAGTPEAAAAHRAFAEYVYNFFAAFLAQRADSLAFLARDPAQASPGAHLTLEHRAATPAPITYDQFVYEAVNGRIDAAIDRLRSLAAVAPGHILLDETYLFRLAHSLLNTWGLTEEAVAVLEFAVERYPSSVNARVMLAEGRIRLGNYAAAIELYAALLEEYPDDAWSRSRLEWLRSQ